MSNRRYTSRLEFETHFQENGLTPVLVEAITRRDGDPDHYNFFNGLVKKGIFDMGLVLVLLDKWEWKDSYLESGVPNSEMLEKKQIPVRLVSDGGSR